MTPRVPQVAVWTGIEEAEGQVFQYMFATCATSSWKRTDDAAGRGLPVCVLPLGGGRSN